MKVRTFICIEIPPVIRSKIAGLQAMLKSGGNGISWSRPEGIHLTLKFLGDVEQTKIEEIAQAVQAASAEWKVFSIVVSGVGAFPNFHRPRVLWIGIQDPSNSLTLLQRSIELELEKLGFPREQRPFSPHLTLARIKSPTPGETVGQIFQQQSFPPQSFSATELIVMRSDLKPNGAVYTPLKIIQLNQ